MTFEIAVTKSPVYQAFFKDLKTRIRSTHAKIVVTANQEIFELYWHIGKSIAEMQKEQGFGSAVVDQISEDLRQEFSAMQGFSRTSVFAMRQMYLFFSPLYEFVPQPVGQMPWGHVRTLLAKVKDVEIALFYANQCVSNAWTRAILTLQIEQQLHKSMGSAVTNFSKTLPQPHADLAQLILKDPYDFGFLELATQAHERDLELQLMQHITKFLLALGKGFAFLGRQYPMTINGRDYFLDLLFYHTKLKCHVVIELKIGEFKPEYIGKMNFYLSAADDLLKSDGDQPTIGLILCKDKDKFDVEYALRDIGKPIGVSSFITKEIPMDVKSLLPTVEELEWELSQIEVKDPEANS
jgi:predicted nuclease of restriction endonuclease-like (RecB) superfamily